MRQQQQLDPPVPIPVPEWTDFVKSPYDFSTAGACIPRLDFPRGEVEDSEEGGKAKGKEGVGRRGGGEGEGARGCKTKEAWPRH